MNDTHINKLRNKLKHTTLIGKADFITPKTLLRYRCISSIHDGKLGRQIVRNSEVQNYADP